MPLSCGSSIPVCTQGTRVVFQCCIVKTEARLFTYLLYPAPTYAAWMCLFPHSVFQCLCVVALACAAMWHHGPTCPKTCNNPVLQHVSLASSAPTHAVSQSHHMVAQACLFEHLPCARTVTGSLGMPVCMPVVYSAAMQQYGMAVDPPAMSQTASAQSCLCVFCVPAPPPDSMRKPVGTPTISHHLHAAAWEGLVIHIPSPTSLTAWPCLFACEPSPSATT